MTDDTYTVELTYTDWMEVVKALTTKVESYNEQEMPGQVKQYGATKDEIIEQLPEHPE